MITDQQISQIKDFLNSAQSVLILVGPNCETDVLAASSALFLSLEQAGKEVVYASPDLPVLSDDSLVGVDRMKKEISNKNLVISFDYHETAVEKVSSHIGEESNRFYLTIKPQKGQLPPDAKTVELGYAGAEADLIFLFGVYEFDQLDQLYLGNEQLFSDATIIAIHNFEVAIGDIKLDTSGNVNTSSAMAGLIRGLDLTASEDAATNLLFSIEETTDSFRSLSITPDLLETAAWLMRQGARRIRKSKTTPTSQASQVGKIKTKRVPQVKAAPVKKKKPRPTLKPGGLDHQPGTLNKSG